MIDFAFGMIFGALIVGAYFHFKGSAALKASPSLDLETVVETVRGLISTGVPKVEDFAATLETRIKTAMSQAGDDLAAKIAALPAAIEAKANTTITDLQNQLAAEQADHQADLSKADAAVIAATPAA
jgi:hypothetical protein